MKKKQSSINIKPATHQRFKGLCVLNKIKANDLIEDMIEIWLDLKNQRAEFDAYLDLENRMEALREATGIRDTNPWRDDPLIGLKKKP